MGINNRNYNSSTPEIEQPKANETLVNAGSRALNMAKVYGYLFLALLVTGGFAFGFGYIFTLWLNANYDQANAGLTVILVISAISLLILSFVVHGVAFRNKHSVLPYYGAYVLCMGVLLSTFTMFIDWRILGMAFGLTAVIIGIDAVIALFAKSNFNWVAMMGMTLLFGSVAVFFFTWWMTFLFPAQYTMMLYIIDFAVFIAITLLTLVDIVRINKIAQQGEMSTNLSLYCSFIIYTDFIYIFIRLVYYIAMFTQRN